MFYVVVIIVDVDTLIDAAAAATGDGDDVVVGDGVELWCDENDDDDGGDDDGVQCCRAKYVLRSRISDGNDERLGRWDRSSCIGGTCTSSMVG